MKTFALLLAFSAVLIAGLAFAQEKAGPAKTPEPYAPGLGDFMTSYVQPHHIKLWLAGQAGNWPLADYEANELGETFEDVTTYQGAWHNMPVAKLVETYIKPALSSVNTAIKARNGQQFAASYETLTTACNSCHTKAEHPFLVVKVPKASDFPDQEFAPSAGSGK